MKAAGMKPKARRDAEERLAVSVSDFIEAAARVVRAGKLLVRSADSAGKKRRTAKVGDGTDTE